MLEIADHAAVSFWRGILDALNTAAMPPEEERRPPPEELQQIIASISENVQAAQKRLAATGGVIKMRHLTKREYLGSMKDLFGDEVPQDILPDEVSSGFQTDQTRVSSYMMPSQSVLSSMEITIPVHAVSHYNITDERKINAGYRDKKRMERFG